MNNDVTLSNYSEYKRYTIWNGVKYKIVDENAISAPEKGISGFTENNMMTGVFVRNEDAFFLLDNKEYKICVDSFECSNVYMDKKRRHFKLSNQDDVICDIVYEPYIDPGMVLYDSDPEEFDILLF
jgi:hypothetical protein